MANHPPELTKEEWAIVSVCVHIAEHFWRTGDVDDKEDSMVTRLKKIRNKAVKGSPKKALMDDEMASFVHRGMDCEFLTKVFLAGVLTVGMEEDPKLRERMMKSTLDALEKLITEYQSGSPMALPFHKGDKEVLH